MSQKTLNYSGTGDQRKHCLFRKSELDLINEAISKATAIDKVKYSFSHFLRRSAVRNAEIITGKRVAP